MEYTIQAKDSAIPCLVEIDEDNGRYLIRKPDTSGEVFHNSDDLLAWVKNNWRAEDFEDENNYFHLLELITTEVYQSKDFID